MALAFGTPVETFSGTAGTGHTIDLSTANIGDLWVIAIAGNPDGTGTRGTVSLPTGWTWIGTPQETGAASTGDLAHIGRVKESGDSATLALTYDNSVMVASVCVTITGQDSTWLDQTVPAYTTGTAPAVSPTITTTEDNNAVLCGVNYDGAPGFGDTNQPSGMTMLGTIVNNPPSNGQNLGFAYVIQASAGASGTKTWGDGASEEYVASTFAIRVLTAGITSVSPDPFDMDESSVTISGTAFGASQGSGTVYISDANTLAGSANEVEIANGINTWSDTSINLDLSGIDATDLSNLHILGPGTRYVIVVTDGSDEYGSTAITLHRPEAFVMSLGAGTPGVTTARLTPPGAKTTGDFDAGRFEEAANPATAVDITTDNYTEMVYSIEAELLSREVAYHFRITKSGTVIDTYTVTPQTTITESSSSSSSSISSSSSSSSSSESSSSSSSSSSVSSSSSSSSVSSSSSSSSSSLSSSSSSSSESSSSSSSSLSSSSSSSSSSESSSSSSSSLSSSSSSKTPGTVVYGHHTAISETYDENFTANWSTDNGWDINGTPGTDGETIDATASCGAITISDPWLLGSMAAIIRIDKYQSGSGPAPTIHYKTSATEAGLGAASWTLYDGVSFVSLGWIQLRLTHV